MVKTVVGDDAHLKALEEHLFSSSPPSQVGVVVGKLSAASDRGLVYALLPTPLTDAGAPACFLRPAAGVGGVGGGRGKGGGKGGKGAAPSEAAASLEFDGEWVAEHARQVSRMLLGGMSVVGIYIWASEASFKATPPAVLSQVIRGVSQAASWYDSGFDERLLIHISYGPRRCVCRICDLVLGSLRPCDFKYSKLLASLQTFRCTYNFKIRLPVVQAEPFKKVISKAISHLAKEVQSVKALIDGDLFSEDMNISSEAPHQVDLVLPFKEDVPAEECSLEGVAGLVLFTGSVSASAYLGPKESISEAISDLKVDIITSLRSRLDIILDEAEEDVCTVDGSNNAPAQKSTQVIFHELREPYRFSFPRRVLIPWSTGIYICDYLQPSETIEDTIERCKEVMSLETHVETSAILEPETIVASATSRSFWDVVRGDSVPTVTGSKMKDSPPRQTDSRRMQGGNFHLLTALSVLLVALLVGFMFAFSGKFKT